MRILAAALIAIVAVAPAAAQFVSHPIFGTGMRVSDPPAAHPRDPVVLQGRGYAVTLDKNKGGAVVSILTDYGQELISDWSAGDQWQVTLHYYSGVKWSNPTQAGGSGWEAWVPSQIVSLWVSGKSAEVIVTPVDWEFESWGGHVMWGEMRLGQRIDLDYAGVPGLIRHEAIVYLPNEMPAGEHREFHAIAHTSADLFSPYRYVRGWRWLAPQALLISYPFWFPRSVDRGDTYQSSSLLTGDARTGLSVFSDSQYNMSHMSRHTRQGGETACTRLGVARENLGLPSGWSRFSSFWYIGGWKDSQNLYSALYDYLIIGESLWPGNRGVRLVLPRP